MLADVAGALRAPGGVVRTPHASEYGPGDEVNVGVDDVRLLGDVARRVTPRTPTILAVHYGGGPADMDELTAVAHEADVHLLEDAAEAHGAAYRGRPVGGLGRGGDVRMTEMQVAVGCV